MFTDIYQGSNGNWHIVDSDYTLDIDTQISNKKFKALEVIILTYEGLGKNTLQAICAYYNRFYKKYRWEALNRDIKSISEPAFLNFSNKYYNCVTQYFKKLDWIGK